jgi:hypothetical protein
MPEISRFFGIVIAMYYNDHEPPHFHARYGSQKAKILIDPPTLIAGNLCPASAWHGDGMGRVTPSGIA